jgi:D-serine dehydratase
VLLFGNWPTLDNRLCWEHINLFLCSCWSEHMIKSIYTILKQNRITKFHQIEIENNNWSNGIALPRPDLTPNTVVSLLFAGYFVISDPPLLTSECDWGRNRHTTFMLHSLLSASIFQINKSLNCRVEQQTFIKASERHAFAHEILRSEIQQRKITPPSNSIIH